MQFDANEKEETVSQVSEMEAETPEMSETFYPASYQQEQTFILDASGAGAAYNMSWIVELVGFFNEDALVQAHDLVVKREQPLRTILRLGSETELSNVQNWDNGIVSVYQKVLPKESSRSLWELCEHRAHDDNEAVDILQREQDYSFDVTKPPISRLHIVRISNTRHLVMCHSHQAHHDYISMDNYRRHVLKTYIALCQGLGANLGKDRSTSSSRMAQSLIVPIDHSKTWQKTPIRRRLSLNDKLSFHFNPRQSDRRPQTASTLHTLPLYNQSLYDSLAGNHKNDYLSFSKQQRQSLSVSDYENQLSYWLKELEGAQPLTFPKDHTAKPDIMDSHSGNMVTFRIEPSIASLWKERLDIYECTPYMGGITLFHIMLSRWFHEKDIVSGAYFANRDEQ